MEIFFVKVDMDFKLCYQTSQTSYFILIWEDTMYDWNHSRNI